MDFIYMFGLWLNKSQIKFVKPINGGAAIVFDQDCVVNVNGWTPEEVIKELQKKK